MVKGKQRTIVGVVKVNWDQYGLKREYNRESLVEELNKLDSLQKKAKELNLPLTNRNIIKRQARIKIIIDEIKKIDKK